MRIPAIMTFAIAASAFSCRAKESPPEPATHEPPATAAPATQPPPAPVPQEPVLVPLGRADPRTRAVQPAPLRYNAAKKADKEGDREGARKLLDEAIAADPAFTWALLLRARIALEEGDKTGCLSLLEKLLALNYVEFSREVSRLAWLKPLRADAAAWGPFQEKMELYRKAWADALAGPGAWFIQGQFRKMDQAGPDGAPLDLSFVRGAPMFWSKTLGRYLPVGRYTDVAGFLLDAEHRSIVLVRWQDHEVLSPGLMGKIRVHRIDLEALAEDGTGVEIASEAAEVRLALDGDGNALFLADRAEQAPPPAEPQDASTDAGDAVEDGAESEDQAAERVNWKLGVADEGILAAQAGWQLSITLGRTKGPLPSPAPGSTGEPPKAKRGGACFWIEPSTAFCFEPTKKGGTWHNLDVVASGSDPVRLTAEPIPLVQY